jgi:uncharacterized protein (DUF1330 family)
MPKGYWIAHVDVKDAEAYKKYTAANAIPFAKFGARFLVRAGQHEVRKGTLAPRHVVLEFESYAVAKACYDSPEYEAAAKLRDAAGDVEIVIVEGYDG